MGKKSLIKSTSKKKRAPKKAASKAKPKGKSSGQESTGDPTESRSQVKAGAQTCKKGGAERKRPPGPKSVSVKDLLKKKV